MVKRSSRLVILGSTNLALGVICLLFAATNTYSSVMTLAAIVFCAGVAQVIYGIRGKGSGQLWPHVALGSLAVAGAILISSNPLMNNLAVTLLVAFFLLAGGLAKIIGAVMERTTGWAWYALNGSLSLLLGGFMLYTSPYTMTWTLGIFIGVDLIFAGLSFLGLGFSIRNNRRDVVSDMRSLLPETRGEADRSQHGSDHDPESSPHLH